MKSTKPFYNRFKHHMAMVVSTAVLACVLVASSASYAATPMSQLPDTAFAKMCFTISGLVYRLVQVKNEAKFYKESDPFHSLLCYKDFTKIRAKIKKLAEVQRKIKRMR